jgi:hypothetical protein
MEGREGVLGRLRAALVASSLVLAVLAPVGCGSDDGAVETADPLVAFAPLVRLAPDEKLMPVDPDWFIDRSVLWWSSNIGCPDLRVAVGESLKAKPNENGVVERIDPVKLGRDPAYSRESTSGCRYDGIDRYYANEHNRPYEWKDESERHQFPLPQTEGFYLDLADRFQHGQATVADGARTLVEDVPVHARQQPDEIGGEPALRASYWAFFAKEEVRDPPAPPNPYNLEDSHEGDWERADVLLRDEGDNSYVPVGVQLGGPKGRLLPWDGLSVAADPSSGSETHPVLTSARGVHTLAAQKAGDDCSRCPRWLTWRNIVDIREQPWYGFGGAWGDKGPVPEQTGPIGPPHRSRPTVLDG